MAFSGNAVLKGALERAPGKSLIGGPIREEAARIGAPVDITLGA